MELVQTKITEKTALLSDVVAELTGSCIRRAPHGALLQSSGAVGVLSGPAPVVWVHGETDPMVLTSAIAASPDLHEVYVEGRLDEAVAAVRSCGWITREVVSQLTHDLRSLPAAPAGLPEVTRLNSGDMADVRGLLQAHGDVDADVVEASYGDDFLVVAAPVWLLGARDASGRLVGTVAVRRQGRSAMGFALTVAPEWRSTGLSVALVAEALATAAANGAEFVHVQARDVAVRRLVRCGFDVVGTWHRLTA